MTSLKFQGLDRISALHRHVRLVAAEPQLHAQNGLLSVSTASPPLFTVQLCPRVSNLSSGENRIGTVTITRAAVQSFPAKQGSRVTAKPTEAPPWVDWWKLGSVSWYPRWLFHLVKHNCGFPGSLLSYSFNRGYDSGNSLT